MYEVLEENPVEDSSRVLSSITMEKKAVNHYLKNPSL